MLALSSRLWHHRWAIALFFAGFLALCWHAWAYRLYVSDDALISLRYSERLLHGQGLTWTDGERVEGYSNLLQVLGAAALGRLGLDLVDALRVLGFAGIGAVIAAIGFASRPRGAAEAVRLLPAVLVPAVSGAFAVWAYGGLEQPLLIGLVAWGLVMCYPLLDAGPLSPRSALWPGLLFGLAALTRPDGALFAASAGLGLLLVRGPSRATAALVAALGALPALMVAGQLAFRRAYYGEWVPNTALVKLAASWTRVAGGLDYVKQGLIYHAPLVAFVTLLLGLAVAWRLGGRRLAFLAVPLVVWTIYVVAIGGDIFPAHRHMLPTLTILALMAADGLTRLPALGSRGARAGLAGALAMIAALAVVQRRDPDNYRTLSALWAWEGMSIGSAIGQAFFREQPLIAVTAAGSLPYWSRLPALDVLGLNDRYLPRHPRHPLGTGYIGHEVGNGPYVLGRQPDLVFFGGPRGGLRPVFFADRDLEAQPTFHELYVICRFQGTEPYATLSGIWVRLEGRVGIRRSEARVEVPAYLFNGSRETLARLDETHHFAITASETVPAVLPRLALGASRWRLEAEPAGQWRAIVRSGGATQRLDVGEVFRAPGDSPIAVTLVPADGRPGTLRTVSFVRVAGD